MNFFKKKNKNEIKKEKRKRLNILIVCGCGLGSSIMLKGVVQEVLDKHNLCERLDISDMLKAPSLTADILVCSPEIKKSMKDADKNFRKIILIDNFLSSSEVELKLLPAIEELSNDKFE